MLIQFKFGTFWLKIQQFWPFEEISIFSHGSHLGYRTALTFSSETAEPISTKLYVTIFGWTPFKMVSVSAVLYPRWLP
jgi:hypothetical protein